MSSGIVVTCSAGITKVVGSNPASAASFCLLLNDQCFGGHLKPSVQSAKSLSSLCFL